MRMPGGMRMSEAPVQLLVAAFTDEDAADTVFNQLKEAKKEKLIHIQDVAVIKRDQDSKIHINEPKDWKAGKGAGVGAVIGAALGIITGPGVVLTTAAGAAIGGLAAKLRDAGFPDDQLRQVGEALKPGTSAIVAIIEHTWVADLEQEMQAQGAQVMRQEIAADITKQLEAGRDVSYSAIATEGAATVQRVSAGENDAQIDSATITQDSLSATSATATAEGITGTTVIATDQGAAVAEFSATPEAVPAVEGPDASATDSAATGADASAAPATPEAAASSAPTDASEAATATDTTASASGAASETPMSQGSPEAPGTADEKPASPPDTNTGSAENA
jgi:uncharacterized membrane protein